MKQIVLFSDPKILPRIEKILFPLDKGQMCYMPADGNDKDNSKYTPFWQDLSRKHNYQFAYIDNSKDAQDLENEKESIKNADLLILDGGDTVILNKNLKRTGLDETIKSMIVKDNFVLAGFSAGAIVLTPTISVTYLPWGFNDYQEKNDSDDNQALGMVDFEVVPHFQKNQKELDILEHYRRKNNNTVVTITDDEYILVDLEKNEQVKRR